MVKVLVDELHASYQSVLLPSCRSIGLLTSLAGFEMSANAGTGTAGAGAGAVGASDFLPVRPARVEDMLTEGN